MKLFVLEQEDKKASLRRCFPSLALALVLMFAILSINVNYFQNSPKSHFLPEVQKYGTLAGIKFQLVLCVTSLLLTVHESLDPVVLLLSVQ